ncbi:hypothetical protein [Entomobacter blattae]|uniref:Uncharacterized protein n=1 Tax=Entomobacter blattae TaxID=2762277 RepID=A0A7H1NT28_9PROT|nr:hypothetical protein [Entomobacter blattae]QNT78938.1 hypothetical protein JGUZn3_17200 [Entomobacter blattae]
MKCIILAALIVFAGASLARIILQSDFTIPAKVAFSTSASNP